MWPYYQIGDAKYNFHFPLCSAEQTPYSPSRSLELGFILEEGLSPNSSTVSCCFWARGFGDCGKKSDIIPPWKWIWILLLDTLTPKISVSGSNSVDTGTLFSTAFYSYALGSPSGTFGCISQHKELVLIFDLVCLEMLLLKHTK